MTLNISRTSIQNLFLYFYFFSINFENFNPTGYFSVAKLAGVLYLVTVLPSIKVFTYFTFRHVYFFMPLLIFVLYLTLISLLNINYKSSRFIDMIMIQNIFIFMFMVNHARKDSLVLEKGMLALGIGSILVGLLLFFGIGLTEMAEDDDGLIVRQTFFNAGPNEIALKIAVGAVVVFSHFINNPLQLSLFTRCVLLAGIPLILIAMVGTGSRAAILILPVCGLAWLFFKVIAANNRFLMIMVGSILLTLITIPTFFLMSQLETFQLIADRISSTGGTGDFSEKGRFTLWIGFFSLIFENPFFGNGYSGFDMITYEYFGFIESPHNVLLEVILYTGFIGLSLYLLFLFRITKAAYQLFKIKKLLLPILALPIAFVFIFILQGLSEKICWLILAYIVGTHTFNNNEKALRDLI